MGDRSLVVAGVVIVIFGPLSAWIASQKGRSGLEGFLLGAALGPLGALLEALRSSRPRAAPAEASEQLEPPILLED